jgi:hypothetical protein
MPRSFAPEASGSHLQKLLFYFGWAGLHNEVPENGFGQVQPVEPAGPANLVKTRLSGKYNRFGNCFTCGAPIDFLEGLLMRRAVKGVGIGTGAVLAGLGVYLFVHDCLILAYIAKPYGDGPAGLIIGPILTVMGVVAMLWRLEKPLFPN